MQVVYPGQANILTLPIVDTSGEPIIAGTVNFYLKARDGDNASKWYKGSDATWAGTEQSAGAATHDADGHWYLSIPSAVWTIGVTYYMYAKQSDNQHIPVGEQIRVSSEFEGPGDHAVTITIRTTVSAALAGVVVWLSTSNNRADSITVTKITNDSGLVTFYLHYGVTYYIHCSKTAYDFISANISPASGSVAFTKDIAYSVAPEGSASDYADSFLVRAIASVRAYAEEPAINAKYADSEIIAKLEQAYALVLAEKNRNAQSPIVGRKTITMTAADSTFVLPYTGTVHAIYTASDYGTKVFYESRGKFNELGRGIWLEGNTLRIAYAGVISAGTILTIEWIPNGTARLHVGTCTVNAAGTIVTCGATPDVGTLDTHLDAYVGCVLRVFHVTGTSPTGDYVQERIITAYDRTTRAATLDVALSPVPVAGDGGYIYYEIAPAIPIGIDQVVAAYAAYSILQVEGNPKRAGSVLAIYRDMLRNVRLDAFYSNVQEANRVQADSYRNKRYRRI